MSTEREDGPTKHYRYVCDQCGKQSKRGADQPPPLPKGWKEVENDPEHEKSEEYSHYCPKCSKNQVESVEEIVPKKGDSFDISDHDEVYRPLTRLETNKLVIDLQDGQKLIITSDMTIKVEQIDEEILTFIVKNKPKSFKSIHQAIGGDKEDLKDELKELVEQKKLVKLDKRFHTPDCRCDSCEIETLSDFIGS